MKKLKLVVRGSIIFLMMINILAGQPAYRQKVRIITTIFPLTELVREVAGERGEVFQLIPTGAEIHDFQLRPSDIANLSQADLVVAVGPLLEPWLEKVNRALDQKPARQVYFYQEMEKKGLGSLDPHDPHLWLDLKADEELVEVLVKTLTDIDPAGGDYYRERGQKLKVELSTLDGDFQEQLRGCRSKIFIVAGHQAFGYLARRYGLQLYSLIGANPEARPGLKKMQEIIELIKKEKVKAIFYESSVTPYYAQAIARETGVKLYPLSTGVHLKPEEIQKKLTFLQLMKQNLETLKAGLEAPETTGNHE